MESIMEIFLCILKTTTLLPAKIIPLNARYALHVLDTSVGTLMVGADIRNLIGLFSLHPTHFALMSSGSFCPGSNTGIISAWPCNLKSMVNAS